MPSPVVFTSTNKVYGALSNGATSLMYEGAPNFPDFSRFWSIIERHKVTIMYTAPTAIRATAQGFTYNLGRVASAAAPYTVGSLAASSGFGPAFAVTGAVFLLAAVAWIWIPETRNAELQ